MDTTSKKIGTIYEIYNDIDNMVYIGSTFLDPNVRFQRHLSSFKKYINKTCNKKCSSFDLFSRCGIDHILFRVVESYDDIDKISLLYKERERIERNKSLCINKNLPITSRDEKLINMKIYRDIEEHKLKMKHYLKAYNQCKMHIKKLMKMQL